MIMHLTFHASQIVVSALAYANIHLAMIYKKDKYFRVNLR